MEHVLQDVGDDRELRIVDPPERHRREHGRHDPRHEHDGADERFEGDVVVEKQREPEAEREFPDGRRRRVENRVADRRPEDRVVPQRNEILEPDEIARAADLRIGEGEPEPEAERIGEEDDEKADRRQEAEEDEKGLPVEQALDDALFLRLPRPAPFLRDVGHGLSPASSLARPARSRSSCGKARPRSAATVRGGSHRGPDVGAFVHPRPPVSRSCSSAWRAARLRPRHPRASRRRSPRKPPCRP